MLEYNALEETNKKLQDENEELKKKCEEVRQIMLWF